jgi:hypothetical protein
MYRDGRSANRRSGMHLETLKTLAQMISAEHQSLTVYVRHRVEQFARESSIDVQD